MNFIYFLGIPEVKTLTVTFKRLTFLKQNLTIQEKMDKLPIDICVQINTEHGLYSTYEINLSAKFTLTHLRKIRYLFHSRIY